MFDEEYRKRTASYHNKTAMQALVTSNNLDLPNPMVRCHLRRSYRLCFVVMMCRYVRIPDSSPKTKFDDFLVYEGNFGRLPTATWFLIFPETLGCSKMRGSDQRYAETEFLAWKKRNQIPTHGDSRKFVITDCVKITRRINAKNEWVGNF